VCTPQEAIDCFQRTKMDVLAIGTFFACKSEVEAEEASPRAEIRRHA